MKNSLLFSLMLLAPATHAADLTIEIVEPSIAETEATPTPTDPNVDQDGSGEGTSPAPFRPVRSYVHHGAGLGYQNKSGDIQSNGMFATYQLRAHHAEKDGWVAFGSMGTTFNVINRDAGSKNNSTELSLNSNGFIGHGFDQRNEGVEFILGLSANLNANGSELSRFKGQSQSRIGPETGLAFKTTDVFATLATSVGIGGDQCSIIDETGQEINFKANGIAFAGIGRLLVSDKFALNVLYMNLVNTEGKERSADFVDTTLFWKLGQKLTFTANCSFNSITQTEGGETVDSVVVPEFTRTVNYGQFQIGFIQQFNRNRR